MVESVGIGFEGILQIEITGTASIRWTVSEVTRTAAHGEFLKQKVGLKLAVNILFSIND